MSLLTQTRKITRAIQNVQRLRQVVRVFARYGFEDIFIRMKLEKFFPKTWTKQLDMQNRSLAQRLRLSFEALGPTFIKLGQLLSTRSDLIPEDYAQEFVKLQDQVQAVPFSEIQQVIESEFSEKLPRLFSAFSKKPLASASIGQVHQAQLPTGEPIVVKVQRPGIEKLVEKDMQLLSFLARLLERSIPEIKPLHPVMLVEELARSLMYELDFRVECNNVLKIQKNLSSFDVLVFPKVFRKLTTSKVLTLEQLKGIPLNELNPSDFPEVDRKKIIREASRAFFKSVMMDGLFHGDLHGGNLFLLPNGKLGVVDFGMVGRLSKRARDQLANMLMALLTEDYENLCYQYIELGGVVPSFDLEVFQREIRYAVSPYLGLSLSEVNVGKMLLEATKIAGRFQIKVPGDWMMVFRAFLTMEAVARKLDDQFNILEIGEEIIHDLMKHQYSIQRLKKEVLWTSKDLVGLLQVLPRQIRWMFQKFYRNDFVLDLKFKDLKSLMTVSEKNAKRVSASLLGSGALIALALVLPKTLPQMGGYSIGVLFFIFLVLFFILKALF